MLQSQEGLPFLQKPTMPEGIGPQGGDPAGAPSRQPLTPSNDQLPFRQGPAQGGDEGNAGGAGVVPDKYKGKSVADVIKMHQEAEALIGRKGTEAAEAKKIAIQLAAALKAQSEVRTDFPAEYNVEVEEDPDDDPLEDLIGRLGQQRQRQQARTQRHRTPATQGGGEDLQLLLRQAEERAVQRVRGELEQKETQAGWTKLMKERGLTPEQIREVQSFWTTKENLTPEFLYEAMTLRERENAARQETAQRMGEALRRNQQGSVTTLGTGPTVQDVGSMQAQLADALARGDHKQAQSIVKKLYGQG